MTKQNLIISKISKSLLNIAIIALLVVLLQLDIDNAIAWIKGLIE